MFNRSRMLLAGLLTAFGGVVPRFAAPRHASGRISKPMTTTRGSIRARYSRYKPHQGERECYRRRGGADWAQYKAYDRMRRGLPNELEVGHG